MFTDEKRAEVYDRIRYHDQAMFAHLLTPELFFQAARLAGSPEKSGADGLAGCPGAAGERAAPRRQATGGRLRSTAWSQGPRPVAQEAG
jgi:hypothetical protein